MNYFKPVQWVCSLMMFMNLSMASSGMLVLETDFGLKDGAVGAMKGVAYSVSPSLTIADLSHEIPPYKIWEGAYRLYQTASYWPKGSVFVTVIDPGVGSSRRSIVAESNQGHYFVGPDNGLLTLIADEVGIKEVREIDTNRHRLPGSQASYTFHGRDVYAYTGALLAAGKIKFNDVGPLLKTPLVKLPYEKGKLGRNKVTGEVVILDPQYGNVWTNIDNKLVEQLGLKKGEYYKVSIFHIQKKVFAEIIPFANTFSGVQEGQNLLYLNSLMNLSIAANQANFAKIHQIGSGPGWHIEIEKI